MNDWKSWTESLTIWMALLMLAIGIFLVYASVSGSDFGRVTLGIVGAAAVVAAVFSIVGRVRASKLIL